MKIAGRYFIIFLVISQFLFSLPMQNRKIDISTLSELLSAFDIQDNDDIIAETQKKWLRSANQERWEMQHLSDEKSQLVLDWANRHNFFAAWIPSSNHYDFAIILGATTTRMQMRLNYLKKLWKNGICFNKIVWLTCERPLDKRVDDFSDICKTESDAAKFIWKNAELPIDMQDLPVQFITVKMKQENNRLIRPNTQDTIVAWTNTLASPCKALFISNQPYCGYQFSVIKSTISPFILFDVAGEGVNAQDFPNANIILDTVARWLYQDSLQEKMF